MSALRTSRHMIEMSYRALRSNSVHTTTQFWTKQNPRRAPSVARSGKSPSGIYRTKKTYDNEECLPPISLLQSARNSGALDIEPQLALEVLHRYQEMVGKSSDKWEHRLCTQYDISPATLALLARILNRCVGIGQRQLARQIMFSASKLGETSATLELVASALRTGALDLSIYAAPLKQIKILAYEETNPQAMMLLGKVLLTQQKEQEAIEMFRMATRSPVEHLDFDGAGEALVLEGRILLGWGDKMGAEAAFKNAAIQLDDPSAYFYLSQHEERGSTQQEAYLLKAASSGIDEACHHLGTLELSKIGDQMKEPGSVRDYGMAREWFQVAAANGFGLSILSMAQICNAAGQFEDGLKWLEKAEEMPSVKEQAKSIKAQWQRQPDNIS